MSGTTSSVPGMSSPSFDSLAEPLHGQVAGRGNDDALARQMIGKWVTRRPLAREGCDQGGTLRVLDGEFVFGRVRLRFLELKLQLVEDRAARSEAGP
jgi:hypothetical protein